MRIGFEAMRGILERRLHQEDIEPLPEGLSEAGKARPSPAHWNAGRAARAHQPLA